MGYNCQLPMQLDKQLFVSLICDIHNMIFAIPSRGILIFSILILKFIDQAAKIPSGITKGLLALI